MKKILFRFIFLLLAIFIGDSCKKEKETYMPPMIPPALPVLLKEIKIPNLPSPYYHFEYNIAGKPILASFASGFFMYSIFYSGNRMSELKNNVVVNKDRLQYSYNNAGKVNNIRYVDSTLLLYKKIYLDYDGNKLIKVVRERKSGNSFIIEKSMTFLYYADGNLRQITEHRYSNNGQIENTYIDRFEQYDNRINVDGFSLLHNEFFEHLFLLPDVQLQKNNPAKLSRIGDGVHYIIDYSYEYNDKNLPVTKNGEATILSGPNAGNKFQTKSDFLYY